MNKGHNSFLTGNAQKLRKNMTKEERHLWYDFLKKYLSILIGKRFWETIFWIFIVLARK